MIHWIRSNFAGVYKHREKNETARKVSIQEMCDIFKNRTGAIIQGMHCAKRIKRNFNELLKRKMGVICFNSLV